MLSVSFNKIKNQKFLTSLVLIQTFKNIYVYTLKRMVEIKTIIKLLSNQCVEKHEINAVSKRLT